MLVILVIKSHPTIPKQSIETRATHITEATLETEGEQPFEINLPCEIIKAKPNSVIRISFNYDVEKSDSLFLMSLLTPVKVYQNNELVFDSAIYKSQMNDSGSYDYQPHLIRLHDSKSTNSKITLEFTHASKSRSLKLYQPIIGNTEAISNTLNYLYVTSFEVSLLTIAIGIILLITTAILHVNKHTANPISWLSAFCLSSGTWYLGINPISTLLIGNSALLRSMMLAGFMVMIPSELELINSIVQFKDDMWFRKITHYLWILTAIFLFLKASDVLVYINSIAVMHIIGVMSEIYLLAKLINECTHYENTWAKALVPAFIVIVITTLFVLYSAYVKYTFTYMQYLQIGIIFLLSSLILIGALKSQEVALQERLIKINKEHIQVQTKYQEKYSELLQDNEEKLKQVRHDLQHHLSAMSVLANKNNDNDVLKYIQELTGEIPSKPAVFCSNMAVNAVIAHYANKCANNNIKLTLNLDVPKETKNIEDFELCSIFANLLENATEAIERMDDNSNKYITIESKINHNLLTIKMINTFNGNYKRSGKYFISSKRDETGIGLKSITDITKSHNGDASFLTTGTVFISKVYLTI